jgi:hypothetical protein
MTNYQNVWGSAQKKWSRIDYRDSHLLTALTVWAWVGMISFFVCASFSVLAGSNAAAVAMLVSLGLWLGCGISVIRIRRGRRKFLKIPQ